MQRQVKVLGSTVNPLHWKTWDENLTEMCHENVEMPFQTRSNSSFFVTCRIWILHWLHLISGLLSNRVHNHRGSVVAKHPQLFPHPPKSLTMHQLATRRPAVLPFFQQTHWVVYKVPSVVSWVTQKLNPLLQSQFITINFPISCFKDLQGTQSWATRVRSKTLHDAFERHSLHAAIGANWPGAVAGGWEKTSMEDFPLNDTIKECKIPSGKLTCWPWK